LSLNIDILSFQIAHSVSKIYILKFGNLLYISFLNNYNKKFKLFFE